ncbi:MAG: hypothetical protein PVI39_11135 [Desulfobacteraceae bacterium]|jgi:hypothetical protein
MWAAGFTGVGGGGEESISVSPLTVFPATTGAGVFSLLCRLPSTVLPVISTASPVLEELQASTDAIVFNLIGAGFVFQELEVSPDLVFQGPQASGTFFGVQIPVHLGEFDPQGILGDGCGSLGELDVAPHEGPPSHD